MRTDGRSGSGQIEETSKLRFGRADNRAYKEILQNLTRVSPVRPRCMENQIHVRAKPCWVTFDYYHVTSIQYHNSLGIIPTPYSILKPCT